MTLFPSHQITLVTSAPGPAVLPNHAGIEIAFLGRSNSGKSTFMNQLCGQKIARTSNTPGKTRLINLFQVHPNSPYYLVDLPGYGFASVSRSSQRKWEEGVSDYLATRKQLKAICLMIDARRGIGPLDQPIIDWCAHQNLASHIVLTKIDQIKQSQLHQLLKSTKEVLSHSTHPITVQTSSSIKKIGTHEARKTLSSLFAQNQTLY